MTYKEIIVISFMGFAFKYNEQKNSTRTNRWFGYLHVYTSNCGQSTIFVTIMRYYLNRDYYITTGKKMLFVKWYHPIYRQ